MAWTAAISPSDTAPGCLPAETIGVTEGVVKTAIRCANPKWQSTYPANRGRSTFLARSDQLRRVRRIGLKTFSSLFLIDAETAFPCLGFTLTAYHAGWLEKRCRVSFKTRLLLHQSHDLR